MVNNKFIITKIKCWPVFKQDPKFPLVATIGVMGGKEIRHAKYCSYAMLCRTASRGEVWAALPETFNAVITC